VIGAVREERVKSFVYVAALAPDEGETVAQVFYGDEAPAEAPKLAPDKHGFILMTDDGFSRAVAHKASTEQTRILAAAQRPISVQCIQEPAPAPGWKAKPSWFLLAEEDRMINPKTQENRRCRSSMLMAVQRTSNWARRGESHEHSSRD
jgi:hypothetical protein